MLKLSKKVEYALIALLHMDGLDGDELEVSREIADRYAMPPELLGKVLQTLARAGLIESVHGAKGGYRLARTLEDISLTEVVEAIEGKMEMVPCKSESYNCERYTQCTIRDPVYRIQSQLTAYLNEIKLSVFRESGAGIKRNGTDQIERIMV